MDNNLKKKAVGAVANRWMTFCVLVFSGGIAFKLSSIKDVFYVPLQTVMGLSNTQIGAALSAYGVVQTIGLILGIYICDMFSKKYMISFSLVGIGLCGIYLSTFPSYYGFLATFAVMAILGEVTYWPVLLKAVRLTGDESEQGRLFGLLEMGRGFVDVIIAFSALWVFDTMTKVSDAAGLRSGLLFYAGATILAGIFCFFMVPHDEKKVVLDKDGKKVSKAITAFDGMLTALKSLDVWAVAINGFTAYTIYCGLTYFIPFLNTIYFLPATLVGAYGIINQYGLKMIGGPVGGFVSDKVFKSSAKYMRFAFGLAAVAMVAFLMLPHEQMGKDGNYMLGMACTLGFGAIIFTMRAVFFAPMGELKVPAEITGAAMSLACLIIYLPNAFMYVFYGNLLDRFPGMQGFKYVFSVMVGLAVVGVFVSSFLVSRINKSKAAEKALELAQETK
ncbi:MAG: MFS transporter [Oscillospiraceae bacterium]